MMGSTMLLLSHIHPTLPWAGMYFCTENSSSWGYTVRCGYRKNCRPVPPSQGSWILWGQQNHALRWNKMDIKKNSRIWSKLNKITDTCLSLQRTVLIFACEENWFLNLITVLNGKQTPSQQEENRTSSQEERRPKLLLLLLLKNRAAFWGERRPLVIAPKAHLHPECVHTEAHRVRAGKRATSQSWNQGPSHATRQVRLHLALRHPCCREGNGTRVQVPTQWSYLAEGQVDAVPRRRCFLLQSLEWNGNIFLWAWSPQLKRKVDLKYRTNPILINVFLFLCRQTSILLQEDSKKNSKAPTGKISWCCSTCHIWNAIRAIYWRWE